VKEKVIHIEDLEIIFDDKNYVHFHFKKSETPVQEAVLKKALEVLKDNLTGKTCLLVSTEVGATLSKDAREFASSTAFDECIKGDAIIRADYSHEMSANFFIRFNRPNRPVKLFPNKDQALDWINELQSEN